MSSGDQPRDEKAVNFRAPAAEPESKTPAEQEEARKFEAARLELLSVAQTDEARTWYQDHGENNPPVERETFVISDVHGNLANLRAQLMLAGVVNEKYEWAGGDKTVVLMGDVIDRGEHSLSCLNLVENLQIAAAARGGQVKYLMGNHELSWMLELKTEYIESEGGFSGIEMDGLINRAMSEHEWTTDETKREIIRAQGGRLREMLADGAIQLAHSEGGLLMTHGLLTQKYFQAIKPELKKFLQTSSNEYFHPEDLLADFLNQAVIKSVKGDPSFSALLDWYLQNSTSFGNGLRQPIDVLSARWRDIGKGVEAADHVHQLIAHDVIESADFLKYLPSPNGTGSVAATDTGAFDGHHGLAMAHLFQNDKNYGILESVKVPPKDYNNWKFAQRRRGVMIPE